MEKEETQIWNTTTTPETVVKTTEQEVDEEVDEELVIEQEVVEEGDLRGGLMVLNTIDIEQGDLIKIDQS